MLFLHLTVSPVALGVLALPGVAATGGGVVVAVALVDTTGLLAGSGETTGLAVLVNGVADPVDAGITADGLVLGVNEDDLEVLVGGVLVDPVGVQDTQVGATAADTLLSGGTESTLVLELVDSHVGGLAVGGTLGNGPLAATASDTDTVDNISLLSLVAETTGLVGTRRAGSTVDGVQLTELPATDAEQEANHIGLLLLLDLFDVLEGTHLDGEMKG
jgi:hypothetical protein